MQLLIVKGEKILVQQFFTKKRKVEKLRFEFTEGSIKAFVASYVPREDSLVLFIEKAPKDKRIKELEESIKKWKCAGCDETIYHQSYCDRCRKQLAK